jgi:hypothetical protein
MNLIEAMSEPGDEPDVFDEMMHAELARRGLTLETWGAQIRAQAQAVLERNERRALHERRVRAAKIAAVATAGLAAATAAGVLAARAVRAANDGAGLQQTVRPVTPPDPGRAPPRGR